MNIITWLPARWRHAINEDIRANLSAMAILAAAFYIFGAGLMLLVDFAAKMRGY